MSLVVDGSNIRAGGGVTHLAEMLSAADPPTFGCQSITVWAGQRTLNRLPDRPWLNRAHDPLLDSSLRGRLLWQAYKLPQSLQRCDLLLVPGGTYTGVFHPFVTMSRNLLPFDPQERARFHLPLRLRFWLLERAQRSTFRRADGVIFLTHAARNAVELRMGPLSSPTAVIPHGVSEAFRASPHPPRSLSKCSDNSPFRWLYVSAVSPYKHQWNVAEAVAALRANGMPVQLDLVGPSTPSALRRLNTVLSRLDPAGQFIRYHGPVPYNQLAAHYHHADAFVFASSCEAFGQILLEAMSAGLPIVCSDRSAMPEILSEAGLYFDPEQPETISQAMGILMENVDLRERLAAAAYERALLYSWDRCAKETFAFLAQIARDAAKPK
jgi:glycosyltransferase involved in cell wall biosynthesis